MPDSPSILTLLLKAIFAGFGFVIPILALVKTSSLKAIEFKNLFVLTAVQVVRIAGILYFILFAAGLLSAYYSSGYTQYSYMGPYWIVYWYPPVMCIFLSQLFWIRKLYIKKAALITLGSFLLLLPTYTFISLLVNSGKSMNAMKFQQVTPFTILEFALNIVVFVFIMFTILLMGRFKKGKG